MEEELVENVHAPCGEESEDTRINAAEGRPISSGYVTTEVAAAALRVSPRTVRGYIRAGELEAISEGEGVQKRWLVSIDSVQALREQRQASGAIQGLRSSSAEDVLAEAETVNTADLVATVQELQYRLGRAEARVELRAVAESTIREERDRLLSQLEEERGCVEAERQRAEQLRDELEQARRSWWRRFFGIR